MLIILSNLISKTSQISSNKLSYPFNFVYYTKNPNNLTSLSEGVYGGTQFWNNKV